MSSDATDRDALKRQAAEAAVKLVTDGMIVGLGTGSTAAFAVEALARRHREGLRFLGIPTSEHTGAQAKAAGIPLDDISPSIPRSISPSTAPMRSSAAR